MATTIRMPQLGETVTEGTVARWLKQPGDQVAKYEAFVEVSTDKVNAEVPSPVSGTIRELIVAEGETVPTGTPIALIDEVGAAAPEPPPVAVAAIATVAAHAATFAPPATNGHNGTRVSPAVRRLAREHAVDVAAIAGTGASPRPTSSPPQRRRPHRPRPSRRWHPRCRLHPRPQRRQRQRSRPGNCCRSRRRAG